MGHEYAGIVEEVGSEVRNIKPGQFVVGSFFASDNTCEYVLPATSRPVSTGNLVPLPVHRRSMPASLSPTARS